MRSIKAIVAGSMFIVVVILFLQLAYIFIAVGYNSLAAAYPVLNEISGVFRYLIGLPVFLMTMFAGGYVTANIANMDDNVKVWFHSIAVALITVGGMMYSAIQGYDLTLTGIVVMVLALGSILAGGLYWKRRIKISMMSQ
jgi:hypothetical protein